jgi:thioesterase domain-containing protein
LSSVRDLVRDLPAWLIGAFELNRAQWLNLVKLKIGMAKARKAASPASAVATQQVYAAKLIEEMGDLFQFSEHHRKVARAQSRALRRYTAQVYPGRITLFRARMQPIFSSHKPDKGWSRLAAGGLEIRTVPGNHLAMLQEPHVKAFAKELRACLDKENRS